MNRPSGRRDSPAATSQRPLTATAVIAVGRLACHLTTPAVAATALAVMLVARYVNIGQIGPFPNLYDPAWFPEKLLAAFAEGVAIATASAGVIIAVRASKTRRGDDPSQP
jgi:hypothetical protein